MRGGKREGAGRPKAQPTGVLRIRLPLEQFKQVEEKGGAVLVKRVIAEALEPKKDG